MKPTIATAQSLAAHMQQMQRVLKGVSRFGRLAIASVAFKIFTLPRSIATLAGAGRLRRVAALRSEIGGLRQAHSLEPSGDRARMNSYPSDKSFEGSTVAHPLHGTEDVSRKYNKRVRIPLFVDRLIAGSRPPRALAPDSYGRSPRSASPRISHGLQTWLLGLSIAKNMYSYASAAANPLPGLDGGEHKMNIRAALEFGRPAIVSSAGVLERPPGHSSQPPVFAARVTRLGQSSSRRVASYVRMAGQIRRARSTYLSIDPGISRLALFPARGLQDATRIHTASRDIRSIERALSPSVVIRPTSMNSQRAGSSMRATPSGYINFRAVPRNSALSYSPQKHTARDSSAHAGGATPVTISYAPQIVIHSAAGSDDTRLKRRVMDILERHGRELYRVLARETLRRERVEFTQSQSADLRFSEAG